MAKLLAETSSVPELMSRFPVIANATPSVVVPPLMVRFLNVVKIVAGRVLVAVSSTVPAPVPGVHVLPAPFTVIVPPTLSVPPAVIVMVPCPGVAPAFPRVRLPQVRVEPLEKVMIPSLAASPLFPIATLPDTVSEGVAPEKVSVPVLAVAVPASCTLAQA